MQQRTEEWYAARIGRFTSTNAKTIATSRDDAITTLIASLVAEVACASTKDVPDSFWMRYGRETEPKALSAYQLLIGAPVADGGFVVHPDYPALADSPDGLVGLREGVVEVKCLAPENHARILITDEIPADHIWQCQWHLFVTGRQWCDFVAYCPAFPGDLGLHVIRLDRDEAVMEKLADRSTMVLDRYYSTLDKLGLSL